MKTSADVVIIGAGAIGTSTAYHLAKAGVNDVILLEMDQVGSGSSSKSASMLSLQFGSNEINARMAKYSYGRFMQFEDEFGTTIDFKKSGWITIAPETEVSRLKAHAKTLNNLDITNIQIELNSVRIVSNGGVDAKYTEALGQQAMQQDNINIDVSLGRGNASANVWTCDLSYDYVKINAEYRT